METISIKSNRREWKKCKKYLDDVQPQLYRLDLVVTELDEENHVAHIGPCKTDFDLWLSDVHKAFQ